MNKKKVGKILGGAAIAIGAVVALPIAGPIGAITIAGALIAGGTGAVAGGVFSFFTDKEKTGLAIFGMQGSGKTTIFNYLRNENAGPGTTIRTLNEFEYKLDNGKTRLIKKGVDIGGAEEYIKKNYAPMLLDTNYDVYFFVFNSFKYLNDSAEQRNINARIEFIQKKNLNNKKIFLIGSHFDKFKIDEPKVVRSEIISKVKDKVYNSLFNEDLLLMDLTDKRTLKEFFNQKAFK
jgi:hypothetical protein